MPDNFDDLPGNTLAERLGLVRCPLKLAIQLTGGGEDGQFANASSQSRFVSQIAVEWPGMSREVGTVEQDTAGAPQPPDRSALGVGKAVVRPRPASFSCSRLGNGSLHPGSGSTSSGNIHSFPSIASGSGLRP